MRSQLDRIQAYGEAHNRHDVESAMSFYADDIRFEMVDVWVKTGKAEVWKLEEWDAAVNGSLSIWDCVESGDTVTCRAAERNDWYKLVGIEEAHYQSCTFVFREGLITQARSELTPESMKKIRDALRMVVGWASRERSEELAMLMPGGEFVYGEENARRWLTLLRDWNEAQR